MNDGASVERVASDASDRGAPDDVALSSPAPASPTPVVDPGAAHLPALRAHVRGAAEDRPGVYRMLSPEGEVVYVGKSKQIRTRLLSYFRCKYPDDKGARIIREAAHLEWDYAPSEFAALLTELRLIKRLRPRFNVAMKRDARHWCFIRVTKGPAPKLQVVRGTTGSAERGGVWYGPFLGARQVTDAVRELSDLLGLRDCAQDVPMSFADQRELFADEAFPQLVQIGSRTPRCLRYEIKKCLGPCVAACTLGEYAERVRLARAFLDGTDDGPLDALRAQMEASAEALHFERAAALRDKLYRLESLRAQFDRMRFAVETLTFAYTVPGHGGEDRVYLVRRGRVRAELAVPRSGDERAEAARMARDVFSPPERGGSAVPTHEVDELLLLSSWFRRFPDELARTVPPAAVAWDAPLADAPPTEREAVVDDAVPGPVRRARGTSGAPRRGGRARADAA